MQNNSEDIKRLQTWQNESYEFLVNPGRIFHSLMLLAFAVLSVLIPVQVILGSPIQDEKLLDIGELSITTEVLYYSIFIIAMALLVINNIGFIKDFSEEFEKFETIRKALEERDEESKQLDIKTTPHYKLIGRLEFVFLFGTFLSGCLWFLLPDNNRLEPLTIIYGISTAIFEYYRTKLNVPTPLDRLIESR